MTNRFKFSSLRRNRPRHGGWERCASSLWSAQGLGVALALLVYVSASISLCAGELESGFRSPPPSARPWVYWFPLDGNLSSNGITADLEAMQRVGIGGVLLMETERGTPPGPAGFAGPLWRALFQHLCREAQRLGLEVNMNNDAGWAGSGGPWITPELSMQKVVWSQTNLTGPAHLDALLPHPETVSNYYREICVLAFPTPAGEEVNMADCAPKLTFSIPKLNPDGAKLVDGDAKTAVVMPKPTANTPRYVQLEFPKPFTARHLALTLAGSYRREVSGEIQISDDGKVFRKVREFDTKPPCLSAAFDSVSARFYRIVFTKLSASLPSLTVAEVNLSPAYGIDLLEAKSAVITRETPLQSNFPILPPELCVAREKIITLSSCLNAEGRLTWDVPAGKWTVLRLGFTTTAQNNYPAPLSGRGLECDKLSKAGAEAAFNGLMSKLIADVGPLTGKTLVSTHIDSWEVGSQNWTPAFAQEFQRLRGYSPLPYLPVLTGRVVDSLEASERFLWDVRQTISDLLVDNYAGHFQELAHQHGIRLSAEAYDYVPADEMKYAGRADEPMGEFWAWGRFGTGWSCTEMASAAHVYGKRILGAEAFTASANEKWLGHPGNIKDIGDWAFCEGINRFVFHRYALQPWTNVVPGISMGPYGLHYERTQTWWEQSKAWHEYLARCQYLLQQGLFVADVCYLSPENAPQRWLAPESRDDASYNFDGCPPEVVLTRMQVKAGRLMLPDGMSYRLLVLPEALTMTPQLLRKVAQLVADGAIVVGSRPLKSPSLASYPQCDAEISKLADELWGDCDGKAVKEHAYGKGRIVWGKTPEQVLKELKVSRDFECQTGSTTRALRYTHRRLDDAEVYFVANKEPQSLQALCSFRVEGRRPEVWDPESGRVERAAVYETADGCTRVPLRFEPNGALFVVFRKSAEPESGRLVSVTRNGQPLLDARWKAERNVSSSGSEPSVPTNNFTMAVWAKPAADIDLPAEAVHGTPGTKDKRNDALYPPPAHETFHELSQAGSGLSIGRNGVCVYEHSDHYFAPVLVCAASLTNWTHVAVVYEQGQPSLYLNGQLVHRGLKSLHQVRSGVGVKSGRTVTPFKGDLGSFQGLARALGVAEITQLMHTMPAPVTSEPWPSIAFADQPNGQLQALLWRAGDYTFTGADGHTRKANIATVPQPLQLTGPWQVTFPAGWGAPERMKFDNLMSWSEHSDPGVKYFSGTATYTKTFTVPAELLAHQRRTVLDIGKVEVMAEVRLNGKNLGILWTPPFKVDVTEALKPGENLLEVAVVNLWVNRMIGDEQLPEDSDRNTDGTLKAWPQWLLEGKRSPTGRYTFTTWRLWKKDDPLAASGLLGPVTLRTAEVLGLQ
jgi:hypothetical protein